MINLIRHWNEDGFDLYLYDTNETDSMGKSILGYTFHDNGKLIFSGLDFHCSPLHAIDSDDTVSTLLGFFAIQDGDTDSEYFENYTEDMLAWRDSDRCETLKMIQFSMEESLGIC